MSKGNVLNKEMLKGMAPDPVIFAMANPTPEISYEDATEARPDCIMATGRSDYPNQVNNVLGFPFIFRGALDVRASEINEEMKLAAVRALADLAKKPVPEIVTLAYGNTELSFGRDYIIPKPVDPRLITTVAPAVAKAAMDAGVAASPIQDWDAYKLELDKRLGQDKTLSKVIETKAKQDVKKVVFADAENITVLKAAQIVQEERIAHPILLGNRDYIRQLVEDHSIRLHPDTPVIDPKNPANEEEMATLHQYVELFAEKRKRKGVTLLEAREAMVGKNHYGCMMVETGAADAMISGLTRKYPNTVRPALHIVGPREGVKKVASTHILLTRQGPLFLADTTINHHLTASDIADITELVAEQVETFNIVPKIALLTYSSFGSVANGESALLMREATAILHKRHPDWIVDGEMQAHMALNPELRQQFYPFSKLGEHRANTLIFPNLSAANIAYNLLADVNNMGIIGPIMLGMKKPIHVLQIGASVREIVDMVGIAAIHAQMNR
ncbi:MAG: phosphate acyltransferase [Saprospiraceae bacterium]